MENDRRRKIADLRGIYRSQGGTFTIEMPHDLIKHRVGTSIDAIRATWGSWGVDVYTKEMEENRKRSASSTVQSEVRTK